MFHREARTEQTDPLHSRRDNFFGSGVSNVKEGNAGCAFDPTGNLVNSVGAKEYDRAIEELQKANLEDSYNLYRLALAYSGKGDAAKAKEYCAKAAHFYSLPDANYAFVRLKAGKMLAGMKE